MHLTNSKPDFETFRIAFAEYAGEKYGIDASDLYNALTPEVIETTLLHIRPKEKKEKKENNILDFF